MREINKDQDERSVTEENAFWEGLFVRRILVTRAQGFDVRRIVTESGLDHDASPWAAYPDATALIYLISKMRKKRMTTLWWLC